MANEEKRQRGDVTDYRPDDDRVRGDKTRAEGSNRR